MESSEESIRGRSKENNPPKNPADFQGTPGDVKKNTKNEPNSAPPSVKTLWETAQKFQEAAADEVRTFIECKNKNDSTCPLCVPPLDFPKNRGLRTFHIRAMHYHKYPRGPQRQEDIVTMCIGEEIVGWRSCIYCHRTEDDERVFYRSRERLLHHLGEVHPSQLEDLDEMLSQFPQNKEKQMVNEATERMRSKKHSAVPPQQPPAKKKRMDVASSSTPISNRPPMPPPSLIVPPTPIARTGDVSLTQVDETRPPTLVIPRIDPVTRPVPAPTIASPQITTPSPRPAQPSLGQQASSVIHSGPVATPPETQTDPTCKQCTPLPRCTPRCIGVRRVAKKAAELRKEGICLTCLGTGCEEAGRKCYPPSCDPCYRFKDPRFHTAHLCPKREPSQ